MHRRCSGNASAEGSGPHFLQQRGHMLFHEVGAESLLRNRTHLLVPARPSVPPCSAVGCGAGKDPWNWEGMGERRACASERLGSSWEKEVSTGTSPSPTPSLAATGLRTS